MRIRTYHDRAPVRSRRAGHLIVAVFCAVAAARGMGAPPTEKGGEGIVHSAPIVPPAPEPAVQEFAELPLAEMPAAAPSLHCALDAIDDHPAPLAMVLDHRVAATFVGWIADDKAGVPENIALLMIGEKTYRIVGTTGLARVDVAAARHNPAFISSGYAVTGKALIVPQGEYRLAMVAQSGSTKALCLLGRTIAIK